MRVLAVLLGRLARQPAPLPGTHARAGASRPEWTRSLLDHAQLLADHTALRVRVLDDHRALQDGPDPHRFAGNDRIEARRNLVVEGGRDAGERNQFCGSTHTKPPKGWRGRQKSADLSRVGPSAWYQNSGAPLADPRTPQARESADRKRQ